MESQPRLRNTGICQGKTQSDYEMEKAAEELLSAKPIVNDLLEMGD
jgi:hypothetical protein